MALLAATVTEIKRLWGEEDLIDYTNPRPSSEPSAIDEDVLESCVNACIEMFARRGYTLDEESYEVRFYSILFIVPPGRRSGQHDALEARLETQYPHNASAAGTGTGIAQGQSDDRRSLDDDTLRGLEAPSQHRGLRNHPRGGF